MPRLTLRLRVFLTVLAIIVLPIPLVWAADLADRAVRSTLSVRADAAAAEAEAAWQQDPASATAITEGLASQYKVRLRVVMYDDDPSDDPDFKKIGLPWVD